MSESEWIREILAKLQESTILIDNVGSVRGPEEDARAFKQVINDAESAITQMLREARLDTIAKLKTLKKDIRYESRDGGDTVAVGRAQDQVDYLIAALSKQKEGES